MANDYTGINQPANGNVPGVTPGVPKTIENPVQQQPWGSNNYEVPNTNQRGKTPLGGGDLSRNYNFGNTYTNLSFERDPFIHLLTKFKKKPTDDFKFEYTIKRNMATFKRYGYVLAVDNSDQSSLALADMALTTDETAWNDTCLTALKAGIVDAHGDGTGDDDVLDDNSLPTDKDKVCVIAMGGDYKINGNIQNKIGSGAAGTASASNMKVGQYLTKPSWFLKNQIVRIPTNNSASSTAVAGYYLVRILDAKEWKVSTTDTGNAVLGHGVLLQVKVVKNESGNAIPTSIGSALPDVNITGASHAESVAGKLEPIRSYIAGSAYHELSGYGDTWKQQPFSTDFGQTQIFKKTAMMSGRAMATSLKFGENPWANEWGDKMAEMTYEIGQAGYFGEQYTDDDGVTYTEGIVNFILNNGNTFSWSDSHTLDDYLEQMSTLHDPRYMIGGKQSHVYYCSTQVYNWHAKLSGFMQNNAEINSNSAYRINFDGTGQMAGVNYRTFTVDGHTMKLVRDIHLDGTNVKMICANMSACSIRPLIGNGVNRDVTVYPGVKTVKNSGEDYRVDLIQGDLGFEFGSPETHAVWI